MNNNIQIVRLPLSNLHLLVKWQKEQIEVGLTMYLEITHVKGPSFEIVYHNNEIKLIRYTNHNVKMVFEKTRAGKWVKRWISISGNPIIQSNGNILNYSIHNMLYCVYATYNLKLRKGSGTILPNKNSSMIHWIKIFNPSIMNLEIKRSFEI